MAPYIKKISAIKDKQTNELIRMQTEDYIDFVSQLIDMANIMKKTFHVVVPYDPINLKKANILDKLFKKDNGAGLRISDSEFKRYKEELMQRANIVASGLGSMGLHCVQLNTEEIIELYYKIYNPDIADKERVSDVESLTSSVIGQEKESGAAAPANREDEEKIIDNSGLVEEVKKQDSQAKQFESLQKANGEPTPVNVQTPATGQQEPAASTQVTTAPKVDITAGAVTPPPVPTVQAPASNLPPTQTTQPPVANPAPNNNNQPPATL